MVERAERQDAERLLGAGEERGDRAHSPVAAARDDRARAVRERASREPLHVPASAREAHARLDAARGERLGDRPPDLFGAARARRSVHDDLDR